VALETRMEGLQNQFSQFQAQMASNQGMLMARLDKIDEGLEKRRDQVNERLSELEQKTPAIIQTIVQVLLTGGVMALVYHFLARIP